LLLPRFRSLAGICLIGLLIVLFPANVHAALTRATLAGKIGHAPVAADADAGTVYRVAVVVKPPLVGAGRCRPSAMGRGRGCSEGWKRYERFFDPFGRHFGSSWLFLFRRTRQNPMPLSTWHRSGL
jgi:hypothetical protein